ncbi:hypothetical protein [Actinocorallia longicatena]|uniref:Uncharacterized protein n=1 Tax=Actinocorallia longicatena TaxID=111803 RepID=A0ABP6Q944_9ACTN
MGCLFALLAGVFPRFGLFIVWLARPALVSASFSSWIMPLLGIVFFPLATLLYVIFYASGAGLSGGEWFWVVVAGLCDLAHWAATYSRRNQIAIY